MTLLFLQYLVVVINFSELTVAVSCEICIFFLLQVVELEVKVGVGQEVRHFVLERFVCVCMDLEFSFVVNVSFVLIWVGVNVGQYDVLTSDSSELDSSLGCTLRKDVAGHRESGN